MMALIDTIELTQGGKVVRYARSYEALVIGAPNYLTVDGTDGSPYLTADSLINSPYLSAGAVDYAVYSPLEFDVSEPDFAMDSIPQMTINLPNVNNGLRMWLEYYANAGSLVATFRRYDDQTIVKIVSFPVIAVRFSADQIDITAEPVNINDLALHKLQYTSSQFRGLA